MVNNYILYEKNLIIMVGWGVTIGHKIALETNFRFQYKIGCITSKVSTNNFIKKKRNFVYGIIMKL